LHYILANIKFQSAYYCCL